MRARATQRACMIVGLVLSWVILGGLPAPGGDGGGGGNGGKGGSAVHVAPHKVAVGTGAEVMAQVATKFWSLFSSSDLAAAGASRRDVRLVNRAFGGR